MGWLTKTLSSTIGRKLIMSLTGLFLIVFLVSHLIGNLLLLKSDGGLAFNEYAHFMKYSTFIRLAEVILFGGFLFHIVDGIMLIRANAKARPVGYVANKSKSDSWTSKLMGPFGIIILIFFILHLYNFFRYKYFTPHLLENMPGTDLADMASLVFQVFSNPIEVLIYVVAMLVIGFHLWHGFQSAFQTLGLNHKKYTPFIKALGAIYSVVIPAAFAIIPIYIYLQK
ncbi:MAG: succinate dehydrogenase cytochrome b subunit [Cyclobacteriaceae bacterium]|nr:succinate dehydrogenase cytochrome b subunit [Cyclobacteriaceae bacterium HetDA_MAG_MS6]